MEKQPVMNAQKIVSRCVLHEYTVLLDGFGGKMENKKSTVVLTIVSISIVLCPGGLTQFHTDITNSWCAGESAYFSTGRSLRKTLFLNLH